MRGCDCGCLCMLLKVSQICAYKIKFENKNRAKLVEYTVTEENESRSAKLSSQLACSDDHNHKLKHSWLNSMEHRVYWNTAHHNWHAQQYVFDFLLFLVLIFHASFFSLSLFLSKMTRSFCCWFCPKMTCNKKWIRRKFSNAHKHTGSLKAEKFQHSLWCVFERLFVLIIIASISQRKGMYVRIQSL